MGTHLLSFVVVFLSFFQSVKYNCKIEEGLLNLAGSHRQRGKGKFRKKPNLYFISCGGVYCFHVAKEVKESFHILQKH